MSVRVVSISVVDAKCLSSAGSLRGLSPLIDMSEMLAPRLASPSAIDRPIPDASAGDDHSPTRQFAGSHRTELTQRADTSAVRHD